MATLKGQQVSVTATVVRTILDDMRGTHTLRNAGASTVYFRSAAGLNTDMVGLDAALHTAGCAELLKGESVVIRNAGFVDLVCATAGTATVDILPGELVTQINAAIDVGDVTLLTSGGTPIDPATSTLQTTAKGELWSVGDGTGTKPGVMLASLVTSGGGAYVRQDSTGTIAKETGGNLATVKTSTDTLVTAGGGGYIRQDSTATIAKETGGNLATAVTALNVLSGSGLTITRVKIDQTAAAGVTALIAAPADGKTCYLHALFGTMEAAGTLTIENSAGADLSGPMPLGANGGLVIPFEANPKGCIAPAAVNLGISINTSQKFYGWALVSSE